MGRLGNLRGRLRKAEREAEALWQVLTLSEGTKVKYEHEPEALLDALMDQDRGIPSRGIPSLVRALGHPAEEENDGT